MKRTWIKAFSTVIVLFMALSMFACSSDEKGEETTTAGSDMTSQETETASTQTESVATEETEDTTETETVKVETTETTEAGTDESETAEPNSNDSETTVSETGESETTAETTTEATVETTTETTEETEETEMEKIYGYDFEDNNWSSLFDVAGSATRELVLDPTGSGEVVLAITHASSQKASYIKNNTAYENTASGKVTVGVDLYIPSNALKGSEDAVQLQINDEYNHHCNLVSNATAEEDLMPFDTKDFPRDKWFTVRFVFDMDNLRYNLEIVEDGAIRTVIFEGRSAANLQNVGPTFLRVHVSGAGQTVYLDNMGVVTTREIEEEEKPQYASGVSFLRIEGINAAGEKLNIFGDFSGEACANDLTDIKWEKSDSYSGTYTAISGAEGLEYSPADGGYYLRVSASYGTKKLVSYPVFIRNEADSGFFKPYLSQSGSTLTAAVVYNNERTALQSEVKVVVYNGDKVENTYTESFEAKQGSDLAVFSFEVGDVSGKRVEMTVISGDDTLCKTEIAADLPEVKVRSNTDGSSVYLGKELLADFSKNRYMRFRPTTANDHWIGTKNNPIDMGFAYQEPGVAGLSNVSVDHLSVPGAFKIVFKGQKVGLKTEQTNELIGFWNSEAQEFSFIYNCSMTADSSTWHGNSSWASSGRIEPFDYHLERMSILDRVYNNNQNGDLYDYVIYENGSELVRIPKLPVPRTAIKGTYFYGFFLSPGESVYYPDPTEGGWKSTVLSDSGDTYVEICWSWYDIHSCSENSVPRLGNCDEFTVSQSWLFTTTTAEHDAALIDDAVEVEWKDLPNYQLPLFSTNNTFETQFGGTNWQYAWWKSTYDCTMDAEVGHDGAGSVKIEKTTSGEASWYTEGVWGFPYSFDDVRGKTYRVSGYIKTENVVGEAYIANIQYQHATPSDNTVHKSEVVSGTTDWTYVTFTFTAQQRQKADGTTQNCIDHFFLTLNGSGTVWFDDVMIEEVE